MSRDPEHGDAVTDLDEEIRIVLVKWFVSAVAWIVGKLSRLWKKS